MYTIFERNPIRELPDKTVCKVYPFHISLEGLETRILCREDEDYDVFVKIICICCHRKNTILVIYSVVSNHAHCVVLAPSQEYADNCGREIKRMFSMYFSNKYQDRSIMKGISAKALLIDTDWYLRNALAYDVRNAMDNGAKSIETYKWTGFRAMFHEGKLKANDSLYRKVRLLTKREKRSIMRTNDALYDVEWIINGDNELEPISTCDYRYLERAFLNDQSFFMKTIGSVNTPEMAQKLVYAPRVKNTDNELLRSVEEISERWFSKKVHELTQEKKARLIRYVGHSFRSDSAQLARVFEMEREQIRHLLNISARRARSNQNGDT